jgi:hypothetical protein
MHSHAIAWALELRRCCSYGALQFFAQVLLLSWIDGGMFAMEDCSATRLRGIAIPARKRAQMQADIL